jgi:hypothetical protein
VPEMSEFEGVLGDGNQSCVKFIQGPPAVPKWQLKPLKLLETVT